MILTVLAVMPTYFWVLVFIAACEIAAILWIGWLSPNTRRIMREWHAAKKRLDAAIANAKVQ